MKPHAEALSTRLPVEDKLENDNAADLGKNASAEKNQMTLKSPYRRKNGDLKLVRKPKLWGDHVHALKSEEGMIPIPNGFDFPQSSPDTKNNLSRDSGESSSGKGSAVTRSNTKDAFVAPSRSPIYKKSKPLTRPTKLDNKHELPPKSKSSRESNKDIVQGITADRSSWDDVYADDDAKEQIPRFRGKKPPPPKRKTKASTKRAKNKDDQAYSIKKGIPRTTSKRRTKPQNTNMSAAQQKSKRTAALNAMENIKELAESDAGEIEKQIQTSDIQEDTQITLYQQNGALPKIATSPQVPLGPRELHCNSPTNLISLNVMQAGEEDGKTDRLEDLKPIEFRPQPSPVTLDDFLYQPLTAKKLETSSAPRKKANHGDSDQPNINHVLQSHIANSIENHMIGKQSLEQGVIGDENSVANPEEASPSLSSIGILEATTLGFDHLGVLDSLDDNFYEDATPWYPGDDACSSEGNFRSKAPVAPMITATDTIGEPRRDRGFEAANKETLASVLKPIQKVPFEVKLKNALASFRKTESPIHLCGKLTASNFNASVESSRKASMALSVNTETKNTANTPEKQDLGPLALSEKFAQDVAIEGFGEEGISKPQILGPNSNIATPSQSFFIKSGHQSRLWPRSENSELPEVTDVSSLSEDPISIKCLDDEDVVCNFSDHLNRRPRFEKSSSSKPRPMISNLDQGCLKKGHRKAVESWEIRGDLHARSTSQQRSIRTSRFDTKPEKKPRESKAEFFSRRTKRQ